MFLRGGYLPDGSVASSTLVDGTALAEILDNDGAGSTLDADLLDGSSSSAYIETITDVKIVADTTNDNTVCSIDCGVGYVITFWAQGADNCDDYEDIFDDTHCDYPEYFNTSVLGNRTSSGFCTADASVCDTCVAICTKVD